MTAEGGKAMGNSGKSRHKVHFCQLAHVFFRVAEGYKKIGRSLCGRQVQKKWSGSCEFDGPSEFFAFKIIIRKIIEYKLQNLRERRLRRVECKKFIGRKLGGRENDSRRWKSHGKFG